jgi:hypothetical protein
MAKPFFENYGQYQRLAEVSPLWLSQYTLTQISEEITTVVKSQKDVERLERKVGRVYSQLHSLFGNVVSYGAADKPVGTAPHRLLREAAKQSIIDALIINARIFQARHVARRVVVPDKEKGWCVVAKGQSDPHFKASANIRERCREMEALISKPNPEFHPNGFRDFFIKAVQGELVVDRKVAILSNDSAGRPRSYHLLPPDDIKPRLEVLMSTMHEYNLSGREGRDQAYQVLYDKWGYDISDCAYVQVLDGAITGAWHEEEISVDIVSPSDEIDQWGYGRSPLERSLEATNMLLMALNYNKDNFLRAYPEAFLIFEGEVNETDLEAFKRQIYSEVGPRGNQRLPTFATGDIQNKAQLLKLRDTLTDMQFIEMIRVFIALKTAGYRAHPSLLNFSPDQGAEAPIISNKTEEETIALSQEEGFHSMLDNVSEWLTRALIEPRYDDLAMVFSVQDKPTEVERIEIWTQKLSAGATVDEWRAAEGLSDLKTATGGLQDGTYVNSPYFFQAQQLMLQQQQAEQEQAAQEQQAAQQQQAEADQAEPQPGVQPGYSEMGGDASQQEAA